MIELRGISKNYDGVKVLDQLSLQIENSESVCVVGPSGSGKSTLLKILGLIIQPEAGSVLLDGTEIWSPGKKEYEDIRNLIAYSYQEPLLIPYVSSLENVLVPYKNNGYVKEAKKVLCDLGLAPRMDYFPSKLSVGEKKRVDIARAILREPRILIADEPLSNLDPGSGALVMNMMRNVKNGGGSIIYSAVDPSHAKWADRVISLGQPFLKASQAIT